MLRFATAHLCIVFFFSVPPASLDAVRVPGTGWQMFLCCIREVIVTAVVDQDVNMEVALPGTERGIVRTEGTCRAVHAYVRT